MRFPIVLWLCMFLRFLHPKTTYKSSQLFEKGVASDKFTLAFWNTSFWFWQNCDLRYFVLTFVNIFQDMFLFTILAPQKSLKKKKKKKNDNKSLKKEWLQTSLLSLFEIHVHSFDEIVIFFCHICEYFWDNVQFLRCFQSKNTE